MRPFWLSRAPTRCLELVADSNPIKVIFGCPLRGQSYTINEVDEVSEVLEAFVTVRRLV